MRYITYRRDESGIVTRTHRPVDMAASDRQRDYRHAERLIGWPEHKVYWDRPSGPANGLAPVR